MPGCSAVGCSNRTEQGFILKNFPRDPQRRKLWASKVRRLNWEPTNSSFLCEVHFEADQWLQESKPGVRKLKPTAVPTIFSHAPSNLKRKAPSERIFPEKRLCTSLSILETSIPPNSRLEKKDLEIDKLRKENLLLKEKLRQKTLENYKLRCSLQKHLTNSFYKGIFNDDQVQALQKKSMAGSKWSENTVKVSLGIKFACGSNGYSHLLSLNFPFPSIRTLQRRLQNITFQPGLLHEVMSMLEIKVKNFQSPHEKFCNLALDEMSITEKTEFDSGTKLYFGDVTFPNQSGKANHALVFMLGGICTRWKQVIAYHFTNGKSCGKELKEIIELLITETHKIGLQIVNITSDMGSSNRAMWRNFGISCSRSSKTKTYISHPCNNSQKITFMADVPHLLKNIKTSLIKNKCFILPDFFVEKHKLPTNTVESRHLKKLLKYQEKMELQLTPKLTLSHLDETHFDKMKVSRACNVLSHEVGAALNFVAVEENDASLKTTAFFIQHIHKWFSLMTSRHPILAISKFNHAEYVKTIAFLAETITLFQNLKVQTHKNIIAWKPIQTGIIISTTSIILLQTYLLGEKNFKFILTSRFCQDYVENFFSLVRSRQVIPTALQFKNNLKIICIAQFLKKIAGSYEFDDREFFPGILELFKNVDFKPTTKLILPKDWDKVKKTLSVAEENCLYNISGYIISRIKKLNVICETCLTSVVSDEKISSRCAQFVNFKQYKESCLIYVKVEIFLKLFCTMEVLFRSLEPYLLQSKDNCETFLKTKFNENDTITNVNLPNCHKIKNKIIHRFINFRLKIFGVKKNRDVFIKVKDKKFQKAQMASKSSAMRILVNKI